MRFSFRFSVRSPMLLLLAIAAGFIGHAWVSHRFDASIALARAYVRCVDAFKPLLDRIAPEQPEEPAK